MTGQYGLSKKWYFPIQYSYWCGHTDDVDNDTSAVVGIVDDLSHGEMCFTTCNFVEIVMV